MAGTAAVKEGVGRTVFVGVKHVGAVGMMSAYDDHGERLLCEGQKEKEEKHEETRTIHDRSGRKPSHEKSAEPQAREFPFRKTWWMIVQVVGFL